MDTDSGALAGRIALVYGSEGAEQQRHRTVSDGTAPPSEMTPADRSGRTRLRSREQADCMLTITERFFILILEGAGIWPDHGRRVGFRRGEAPGR